VGPRAVLDAVVKRKIPSPRRKSNPRNPIVQPLVKKWGAEKNIWNYKGGSNRGLDKIL
jgi:hypothetical protein